ncbi:hypothetical protein GJ744_002883 [Endocarpon pusillum]|uniref:Protein kinase domain-containing protein n=1 Tax=Endocarpon pusillum TaxID=364733 RepID=A0A8H7DYK2_9EURO|nr:hypothetical protein GJ744_002883 [Endocarpon pusillum]
MDADCMAIRIEDSPTGGTLPELEPVKSRTKQRMWRHKLNRFFGKDGSPTPSPSPQATANKVGENQESTIRRDSGRRVGVGLPRPPTFRRQNSEKRERLEAVQPGPTERRAVSAHRQQRAVSAYQPRSRSSPSPNIPGPVSAPSLSPSNGTPDQSGFTDGVASRRVSSEASSLHNGTTNKSLRPYRSRSQSSSDTFDELARDEKEQIDHELDTKWILNLSMHFRDKSDREKFFVTFAEEPNRWRRVTISCDYRTAEPDSLEMDLKELRYQRDKNAQIYESIRDSLSSIQFYNTVTNLKLETEDGRLHVHVTEDVNEIIPYPPRLSVQHILADRTHPIREAREHELNFLSHLSGFVYKISFQGREYIKKEIPGPDTVDEFLYEVNALHALSAASSVIKLEAIVMDDSRQTVKGLLISYAERGALVDLLYDNHQDELPWADRVRWARQAIEGLSEIHEEGYVQGDFTLSNIVINKNNDAKIIDINRRGCPVGWEPPEIASKIASNQRISMYIGSKSDLYQLGMTLWALAMCDDEPERHDQPLSMENMSDEVPDWFKMIVKACLSRQPRDRPSAKELLRQFPVLPDDNSSFRISSISKPISERSPKRYIEPCAAVEREDLERLGRARRRSNSEVPSTEDASLIEPPSSSYQFDSGSSFVGIRRDVWDDSDLAPRIISVSPGRGPRYEGVDTNAAPSQEHQSSVLPAQSTPPQHGLSEQPFISDEKIARTASSSCLDGISEVRHEPDPQSVDADLELPNPHQLHAEAATTSIISDSTPRNAHSIMATSTSSISSPPPPPLDLAIGDLAGFGGHPTLEEYSPHEPMKVPDAQCSLYYDTQAQQQSTDSTDLSFADKEPLPPDSNQPTSELLATDFFLRRNESCSADMNEPPTNHLPSTDMTNLTTNLASISESGDTVIPSAPAPQENQSLPAFNERPFVCPHERTQPL